MHIWALRLSCETPAAPPDRAAGARTRQPEFWAPPFGAPPFGAPPFGAAPFGVPFFLGLGLHPRASTLWGPHPQWSKNSTSKNWPKSNWPKSKLAEVEIGRSRNWLKSKLAEVELAELEKKSWPKSKLAEVDRAPGRHPLGAQGEGAHHS